MTVETLPRRAVLSAGDLAHVFCHDPDRALCGAPMSSEGPLCAACERLNSAGVPCGVAGC